MKKKIAILGSTGSIGKTLLKIINNDKNNFEIVMLSANKNYKILLKQAKKFNVKNIIINDSVTYKKLSKKDHSLNYKIYNSFDHLHKIFNKKIDYVMSSIVGIEGLNPTLNIIKYTKKIAIANKESIVCGWNLISKELKKYKTEFIPVDSEHFSMWYGLSNQNKNSINKIYITASGGPFLNISQNKLNNVKAKDATNHPNWRMGKKISIDSATMINKIYEVIEAKNIFNIPYENIKILIHPKSYVHAIIKFNSGMIKIIVHETTMKIPIFNTLFFDTEKKLKTKNLNLDILNNMNFSEIKKNMFPMIKILKLLPNKSSLFETVVVSANDTLVKLFLENKIKFKEIYKKLFLLISSPQFLKYKKISPKKIDDVLKLHDYVRLKLIKKVYKFQNVKKTR